MVQFKHGAHQSKHDYRDFIYSQVVEKIQNRPTSFFHEKVGIKDQGSFGTCVGFASSYIKEIQEKLNYPVKDYVFSPLFIYDECKKIDGNVQEGTEPRAAMKVLQQLGSCREAAMQYSQLTNISQLPVPSEVAYDDATKFKISTYARLQSLDDIKDALIKTPVLGAIIVSDNFVNCEVSGVINDPQGNILGGHAICIDGFDDNVTYRYQDGTVKKGFLRFVNSWGETWGDKGYGYIPYDFFNIKIANGMNFFQEAWSSIDIQGGNADKSPIASLWINKRNAIFNGQSTQLNQCPVSISGKVLAPINSLSDVLGINVTFDSKTKRVDIYKK